MWFVKSPLNAQPKAGCHSNRDQQPLPLHEPRLMMAHFWAPAICAVIRPRIPGGTSAAMYAWQVIGPMAHRVTAKIFVAKPTNINYNINKSYFTGKCW